MFNVRHFKNGVDFIIFIISLYLVLLFVLITSLRLHIIHIIGIHIIQVKNHNYISDFCFILFVLYMKQLTIYSDLSIRD